MSLVSRKSIDKSFASHYLDSIYISDFAEKQRNHMAVFDLGTGAGFPGIVYAIRYPEAKLTLYEKMLKKQTFLTAALTQLGEAGLENVRLEGEIPLSRQKGLFLARAVLPPSELFPFIEKRMEKDSVLIVNIGGSAEPLIPPKEFLKTGEQKYELPLECGARRVESFLYVPRGTKQPK